MDTETLFARLQDKFGRHRLTIPKHTIKQADWLPAAARKCSRPTKPKAKLESIRAKPVAYKRLADKRRIQIETLLRQGLRSHVR